MAIESKIQEYFQDWYPLIDTNILNTILFTLEKEVNFYPQPDKIFECFTKCTFNNLKVVFIGIEPYNIDNKATGLAFANEKNTIFAELSPPLKVLVQTLKEHYKDLPNFEFDYSLESWSKQGVLLLNAALTSKKNSYCKYLSLWEPFIVDLLIKIKYYKPNTLFVFFGKQTQLIYRYVSDSPCLLLHHPIEYVYLTKTQQSLPNIYKTIDDYMIKLGHSLIYWL